MKPPQVLLYYRKDDPYHHNSAIEIEAIKELGVEHGFAVDATEDRGLFGSISTACYLSVIFLNTACDGFSGSERDGLVHYLKSGGGYVGIHAACYALEPWPWYQELVGAEFTDHPAIQPATLNVINPGHVATKNLPSSWVHTDEWYNFRDVSDNLNVLITVDEQTYTGGTHGIHHPVVWCQEYEGVRSFYTALGHPETSFREERYLRHIANGIKYAMGVDEGGIV
jgi:type 1 glutamine amidotransferase